MTITYNREIVCTELREPGIFTAADFERVVSSLRQNGLAVVRHFLPPDKVRHMRRAAEISCQRGYGIGGGFTIDPSQNTKIYEFRHPYLTCHEAVEYVTSENLLRIIEAMLDEKPIIHSSLYQHTFPSRELGLDFHIDCGSIKSINGRNKFSDIRVRTILYLSDVKSGGLSYILNSHEAALRTFMKQPIGELFPESEVPRDPNRVVTVHEPAGTLILFNTHGLHRPEIPEQDRIVLNTWFARNDFSGKLPPILFSAAAIPYSQKHRIHIFENERRCSLEEYSQVGRSIGLRGRIRSVTKVFSLKKTNAY
jgi:hypothetical protein